jgi:hypothetical protein
VDLGFEAIAISLAVLTGLLTSLVVRGVRRFVRSSVRSELAWVAGLAFATVAMAIETAVYVGIVSPVLLEAYVFSSAAIVGVLSLGAVHVFRRPRVERAFTGYILATSVLVAGASFLTPLSASSMVSHGIITGNPSLLLLILSSLVTFPATVVLLAASAVALRRSRKWHTLLLISGALILGVGGTLYIASFPVALYYAEFLGIVLLFFGLVSLPHASPTRSSSAVTGVAN